MKPAALGLALLTIVFSLSASCGRKAPPRLPEPVAPPSPPALGALQRVQPREVVLRWRGGEGAEAFVVTRSGPGAAAMVVSVAGDTYVDQPPEEGEVYSYRVSGVGPDGKTGASSNEVVVGPVSGLAAPYGLVAVVGADWVELSWGHPAGDALFNVYARKKGEVYPFEPLNPSPFSAMTYRGSVHPGETVYYAVRQAVAAEEVETVGPLSPEATVSPDDYVPSAPGGLVAVSTGDKVLVFWDENPESWVRGYRVYREKEDEEPALLGEGRTPALEDRDMEAGKRRYFVGALGPSREGPLSGPGETEVQPVPSNRPVGR